MPIQPTYPGVYVQEISSGVRPITGVSTSIALFIGVSAKGPLNKPVRCVNYTAFKNKFGEDTIQGRLAQYIKLFFLNGGSDCWVMRIASGEAFSGIALANEAGAPTIKLEAKDPGLSGDYIRALVTYRGAQPEANFSIGLFRWEKDSQGTIQKKEEEYWPDMSMDPNSPRYFETFLNQQSLLVNATNINGASTPLGVSISGRVVPDAGGGTPFQTAWSALLGSTVTTNTFMISVAGLPYVNVNLSGIAVNNTVGNLESDIAAAIHQEYLNNGIPGVSVTVDLTATPVGRRMKIKAALPTGDVFIKQGNLAAGMKDLAAVLMLGTSQGGIEISGFADQRPAPNGIVFQATAGNIDILSALKQSDLANIILDAIRKSDGALVPFPVATGPSMATTLATDPIFLDAFATSYNGHSDGIREKLQIVAGLINNFTVPIPGHDWPWRAEVWGHRLAILPKDSTNDNFASPAFAITAPAPLTTAAFIKNVHLYALGSTGLGTFQSLPANGNDGSAPTALDYDDAYDIVRRQVDLFNLLVLPPVAGAVAPVTQLYAAASVFCLERRAFLIMDAPDTWTDTTTAVTGIAQLRIGLVKDYSAVFIPHITINDNGLTKRIGPAGAIAGLFARIDVSRGVWKAPAGTEADLRGINGLHIPFSDAENGILNPRAINTIRVLPSGIVNWGARTNQGDDDTPHDYKYIPVRRTALFIEESLYRGLKWVVFEPNDEPLWAQIRLNVGAFMHNLFRQGAFQGVKSSDAYFVMCDDETTTQNDINLGIVNIIVGFAPLKPAEFVVLTLQQMAGNILT